MSQHRVSIFDTTLRDGEQSPGCSMNLREKVRMAMKLQDLGVDIIEAGFPIASEGDYAAVRAVAAQCREIKVAALCRTAEQDVARAAEALKDAAHPRIHTFVATSDIHLEHKLKKTRDEVIEPATHEILQDFRTRGVAVIGGIGRVLELPREEPARQFRYRPVAPRNARLLGAPPRTRDEAASSQSPRDSSRPVLFRASLARIPGPLNTAGLRRVRAQPLLFFARL